MYKARPRTYLFMNFKLCESFFNHFHWNDSYETWHTDEVPEMKIRWKACWWSQHVVSGKTMTRDLLEFWDDEASKLCKFELIW